MNRENKFNETAEFEGGTVEEAINLALKQLKVSRDEVTIKVVSEEKKGLFGMQGEKPAKIKVSFKKNKKSS